jgi:hypothetical protein
MAPTPRAHRERGAQELEALRIGTQHVAVVVDEQRAESDDVLGLAVLAVPGVHHCEHAPTSPTW